MQDIGKIAKGMDIHTYSMKKTDLIQTIKRKENNIDCYGTNRIDYCEEVGCLRRNDCLALNNSKTAKQK